MKCVLKDRDSIEVAFIDVSEIATIEDIINELKYRGHISDGRVNFSSHYSIICPRALWDNILYVISDGKVIWNPNYEDVKVSDYFSTFKIEDRSITVLHGSEIEIGNGSYIPTAIELWESVILFIVTLDYLSRFYKWFAALILKYKTKAKKLEMSPDEILSLIISKEQWYIDELIQLTNKDKLTIETMLGICGYCNHKKQNVYLRTDNTDVFIERFERIDYNFDNDI